MLAEPKSSKMWDLSAIGGSAFTEVQEGANVSSVVASALFRRQPDERHILSELGKASQLFMPYEPGKKNARRQNHLWDFTLSIRDALGLGEDFVPNVQLSENRRFRVTRQLLHLCATVMTFDMTLAISDAWGAWLQHCHPTDDEFQTFLSFDSMRTPTIPALILRPTASLFKLFQDARKLAEPDRRGTFHPHRRVWDAYGPICQSFLEFYDGPGFRQANGISEDSRKQASGDITLLFFSNAYSFMRYAGLKQKALDNPPSDEFPVLAAYMPRSLFLKIDDEIIRYLKDETDELPYSSKKCSRENPLGLLTVSPKAHKEKHWCAGVVPVDLSDWPAFIALQERGFYRIDDPRNVDALELHRQVGAMVLEVLGREIWRVT